MCDVFICIYVYTQPYLLVVLRGLVMMSGLRLLVMGGRGGCGVRGGGGRRLPLGGLLGGLGGRRLHAVRVLWRRPLLAGALHSGRGCVSKKGKSKVRDHGERKCKREERYKEGGEGSGGGGRRGEQKHVSEEAQWCAYQREPSSAQTPPCGLRQTPPPRAAPQSSALARRPLQRDRSISI